MASKIISRIGLFDRHYFASFQPLEMWNRRPAADQRLEASSTMRSPSAATKAARSRRKERQLLAKKDAIEL